MLLVRVSTPTVRPEFDRLNGMDKKKKKKPTNDTRLTSKKFVTFTGTQ